MPMAGSVGITRTCRSLISGAKMKERALLKLSNASKIESIGLAVAEKSHFENFRGEANVLPSSYWLKTR